MALYQDGILISGANQLPQMTMAEYLAIPVGERPTYWVCTDRDYSDLSADNVTYGSGSVADALDNKVSKSGDTVSGALQVGDSSARGVFVIMGNDKTHISTIYNNGANSLTENRNLYIPDKTGVLALISDVSSKLSHYQLSADNINDTPTDFSMGLGIIDNIGYVKINIGWIALMFQVTSGSISVRMKYGNNGWTGWTRIQ